MTETTTDFDGAEQLTEQELKHLPIGYVTVYREMGWRMLRTCRSDAAIHSLNAALAAEPADVRTLIGRSYAHLRKNLFREAQSDANRILKKNPYNLDAILLQAHCQYRLGDFEQGLVMYHRGLNKRGKRRIFDEGRQAVAAALENCVGRHAGPMLTELQPYIAMIRNERSHNEVLYDHHLRGSYLDSLNQNVKENCNLGEWQRQQKWQIVRDEDIAKVYLGRLIEDRTWCNALVNRNATLSQTGSKLEQFAQEALNESNHQLDILRARKPLYHFKQKYKSCHSHLKKQDSDCKRTKEKLLHANVNKMFKNLNKIRKLRQVRKCLRYAHQIKINLDQFPKAMKTWKFKYLQELCETIGSVYMDKKEFEPHLSKADNRQRVRYMLGLDTVYNDMKLDADTHNSDFPYFDYTAWMKQCKEYLLTSELHLEKAWLHYEVACTYGLVKKWEHLIAEANKAAACAKQCGNLMWQVNALFLAAKGESQRRDGETMEVLQECFAAAHKLKNEAVLEFLTAAKQELLKGEVKQNLEAQGLDAGAIIRKREQTIVQLQDEMSDKERVRHLLARMRYLPSNRRMALVPGLENINEEEIKHSNKSIIPGGSGGRLGLHPVTSRTYYEFLEIGDPFDKKFSNCFG